MSQLSGTSAHGGRWFDFAGIDETFADAMDPVSIGRVRVMLIAISGDAEHTPLAGAWPMDRTVIRAAQQSPEPSRDKLVYAR
ncbi:hypothetical protein IFM12275_48050 [Nocardia sputorum]|jgi:hypothetical protein|uniref:Uncharacterized protein n=1 Tax=Nocardia sputorum TaxID=2984338 RepID=A0ABN6U9U5_9NOCA|nr:hypothetical protein IFM12275_48050 [Nocardia sputorum]BDU01920.1 hypothetical protein IFM12276_49480 [Nocardia sputorum]